MNFKIGLSLMEWRTSNKKTKALKINKVVVY